jgi:hypothetical protein
MLRQVEMMQSDHLKLQREMQKDNIKAKYELAELRELFEKKLKNEKNTL